MAAVSQLQCRLQFRPAHLSGERSHQLLDIIDDLRGDLRGDLGGTLSGDLLGTLSGTLLGNMLGVIWYTLRDASSRPAIKRPLVHRQPNQKPGSVVVAFEDRRRGAVLLHGSQNLGYSG